MSVLGAHPSSGRGVEDQPKLRFFPIRADLGLPNRSKYPGGLKKWVREHRALHTCEKKCTWISLLNIFGFCILACFILKLSRFRQFSVYLQYPSIAWLRGDDRFFHWKHLLPLSFRQLPLQQSHTAMGAFYIQRWGLRWRIYEVVTTYVVLNGVIWDISWRIYKSYYYRILQVVYI